MKVLVCHRNEKCRVLPGNGTGRESALDPLSMAKIEDLIDDLKQHVTIAIVTHNMQQAARCADQVAFFYLGEIIEVGSAAQIFTTPRHKQTQNYVAGKFG